MRITTGSDGTYLSLSFLCCAGEEEVEGKGGNRKEGGGGGWMVDGQSVS